MQKVKLKWVILFAGQMVKQCFISSNTKLRFSICIDISFDVNEIVRMHSNQLAIHLLHICCIHRIKMIKELQKCI